MKKIAQSIARGMINSVETRVSALESGKFTSKEKAKETLVNSFQNQYNNLVKKVYSSGHFNAILNNRGNNITDKWEDRSTLGNLYQIPVQGLGLAYDAVDRWALEEVPNTAVDTIHSITSTIPYGVSLLTGNSRESHFEARDYSRTTFKNFEETEDLTYDKSRVNQVGIGLVDTLKGTIYGNANKDKESKEYQVSTGILGLGKTAFVDVWGQGLTQTFQNIHDSLYASTTRTFSGLKNTVTGTIASPFSYGSKAAEWAASQVSSRLKGIKINKPNISVNFNLSNFQNARDDDGQFKSYTQRFYSIFQSRN